MGLAFRLLDWMTHHYLPLQIWREADEGIGIWVVVDASRGEVRGSGATVMSALIEARMKDADEEVERILNMSDEEICAEIRASGEDPDKIAARVQRIVDSALASCIQKDPAP